MANKCASLRAGARQGNRPVPLGNSPHSTSFIRQTPITLGTIRRQYSLTGPAAAVRKSVQPPDPASMRFLSCCRHKLSSAVGILWFHPSVAPWKSATFVLIGMDTCDRSLPRWRHARKSRAHSASGLSRITLWRHVKACHASETTM